MPTIVTILGEPTTQGTKPIEFVKSFDIDGQPYHTELKPKQWGRIDLICRNYGHGYDLMYAYGDTGRNGGVLYLGYFNDGIV